MKVVDLFRGSGQKGTFGNEDGTIHLAQNMKSLKDKAKESALYSESFWVETNIFRLCFK